MELKIVLEEQEEGGYTVYVPALPGCISEGDTMDEAINNIKEAIELYLDTDIKNTNGGKIMTLLE
ncbi:MAG: type II toxin-antitoxin system HicB family antitoxin [Nanoarchaeota archaeon]|nr:type II toxin-antitoxin system HicB family antitoxin [Nanoarchaeota archaeon]